MSAYEERLKSLRNHIDDAGRALAALPDEHRTQHAPEIQRLERVVAFAALVLERTDPEFISDAALNEIQAAASNIMNDAATASTNSAGYGDPLLLATLRLPAAQGRDLEQAAKDAAKKFQQSASARLTSLRGNISAAKREVDGLKEQIATRADEFSGNVAAATEALQTRVAELEAAITAQKQALDELTTRQSSTFTEKQEERASEFQAQISAFRTEIDELKVAADLEVQELVQEIRRMEKESSDLVGAIGLAGTAERYSEEVTEQGRVADRFRMLTILFALTAVAMGIYAVVMGDQTNQALAAKLAVSVILGGLAAYSARQSARHRRREEQARRLQLELTAFGPFIEPLQPEQREEERVIMARKTFGKSTVRAQAEEEPGPTPLSFLLRRRQKELETGE
jgi:hypothetical protein